jgi:iron complex transport system substrate-binding protein
MCFPGNSRAAIVVTIMIALAGAMLVGAVRADATVIRDATGRTVEIRDSGRIVSIGGAITEILYALGLQKRIVAIDSTSFFPPQALQEKPNVGYMRALSSEGVLGLAPSLILASEGAGPKETLAVLQAASVPFVLVADHFTGDGILDKVRIVAAATEAEAGGQCLGKAIRADLDALANLRQHVDNPVRVLFLLSFMNGRPMVAGRTTAADGVIRMAGAVNAVTEFEGYKLVSDEAVIAARPDVVLAIQRDSHPLDANTVFSHPAFMTTPAAARQSFVSMGGLYLLGFGPRTALAARDLATSLYPALSVDKFPSEQGKPAAEACR